MYFLHNLKRAVYPIYKAYIGRFVISEGYLKGREDSIRILYFFDQSTRQYLEEKVYSGKPRVIESKVVGIWQINSIIRKYSPDITIAYVNDNFKFLLKKYDYYRSPLRVHQTIDVSGSWEVVKSKFSRARRTFSNQVKSKYGYDYRISKDPSDFKRFYYDFYYDYIKTRFNKEYLYLESYEHLYSLFEKGFLLFITHNKQDLAASICDIKDTTLRSLRVGAKMDENGKTDNHAGHALYYYTIQLARRKNLETVDVTTSQAYFNDGVFYNKKCWGASIYYDKPDHFREYEYIPYYIVSQKCKNAVAFLSENPFIFMKDKKLYALIGWEKEVFSEKDAEKIKRKYYVNGLEGMIIFSLNADKKTQLI